MGLGGAGTPSFSQHFLCSLPSENCFPCHHHPHPALLMRAPTPAPSCRGKSTVLSSATLRDPLRGPARREGLSPAEGFAQSAPPRPHPTPHPPKQGEHVQFSRGLARRERAGLDLRVQVQVYAGSAIVWGNASSVGGREAQTNRSPFQPLARIIRDATNR